MEPSFIIRPASKEDAKGICNVHHSAVRALSGGPYDKDTLNAWHDAMTVEKAAEAVEKPDMLAFVAKEGGEGGAVIGFALLQKGLVNAIYVHPRFQGKGVGSGLLAVLEGEAVSSGVGSLTLNVSLNARQFYEGHGFRVVREDVTPLNEEVSIACLVMEKELEVEQTLTETVIRRMTMADLGAVTWIYNEAVCTTTATFDTEPRSLKDQEEWFLGHGPKHPVLVSEVGERVVGWASLSKWSDRGAYAGTAELSVYVEGRHRGKGVGRRLVTAVVEEGKKAGLHTLIARIATGNDRSIGLFKSLGFEEVGTLREVGHKFGSYHGVIYMQMIFDFFRPD
ncbi:MAG: GNAT family N-acetyltransferase [Deltaproteobacteria bacterium]|uniref:GNAT family N-acetyltransferase n=1 Tax=Candidatus Zymogenus saltonus TaxID=2844893 RepID=A0A9D8KCK6_9DELT|nr:GNAT family N-acetyltransferase [Candidatus Zymogenus saltonus]